MFKKHKCNSIQKNSLLYSLNGQASLKLTNINMQIIGICIGYKKSVSVDH